MWTVKEEFKAENASIEPPVIKPIKVIKCKTFNDFLDIKFRDVSIEDMTMGLDFRNRRIYEVTNKGGENQKRIIFGYIEYGDERKLKEMYHGWYNEKYGEE